MKRKSIIYVNFSPYENAGYILRYLLDSYECVLSFTFNFHKLEGNDAPSNLTVYVNKRVTYTTRLFQTPTDASVAFILLPLRSILILLQIMYHTYRLNSSFGPYDIYFTVNAFIAWVGLLLKRLRLTRRVVFWVWDYYPPVHKSRIITFNRWMYWIFDRSASIHADKTVFLNNKMFDLRKKLNIYPRNDHAIIGIGTNPINKPTKKKLPIKLAFIGVIKQSQGLELVLNAFEKSRVRQPIEVHIVGGGPDYSYLKNRARSSPLKIRFHGYIKNERAISNIIAQCHIGIATYVPEKGNVSYYGDPSKIKTYLSMGIPVITTDVFEFSQKIKSAHAGIIIPYDEKRLRQAIISIMNNYAVYSSNALALAKQYVYTSIYGDLFT